MLWLKAEVRATLSQPRKASDGQQTVRSQAGGLEQTLTQPPRGTHSIETILDFWPPGLPDRRFLLFKAPVCGTL